VDRKRERTLNRADEAKKQPVPLQKTFGRGGGQPRLAVAENPSFTVDQVLEQKRKVYHLRSVKELDGGMRGQQDRGVKK